MLIIGNDAQFKRLCDAIGLDGVPADDRFRTNEARVRSADELCDLITDRLVTRPCSEWLELLEGAQVPCAPINDIAQVFADPHVIARGMLSRVSHPLSGSVPVISNPIRFGKETLQADRAPPLLGQHTAEVLHDVLGLSDVEIEELRASGAVG